MLSVTARNIMLDRLAAVARFVSLHTAWPRSGEHEVTGGTPPYVRRPISWLPVVVASLDADVSPTFDVAAGVTVTHAGLWSAVDGGTFYGSLMIDPASFAIQGTYSLTAASVGLN